MSPVKIRLLKCCLLIILMHNPVIHSEVTECSGSVGGFESIFYKMTLNLKCNDLVLIASVKDARFQRKLHETLSLKILWTYVLHQFGLGPGALYGLHLPASSI